MLSNNEKILLGGALGIGLGAAGMFFLDPSRGHRRRVKAREKALSLVHKVVEEAAHTEEDLKNRAAGLMAEVKAAVIGEQPSDDVLVARVRSRLGHVLRHAQHIEVSAKDGVVTLKGKVTHPEYFQALHCVRHTPGVLAMEYDLDVPSLSLDVKKACGALTALAGAGWAARSLLRPRQPADIVH